MKNAAKALVALTLVSGLIFTGCSNATKSDAGTSSSTTSTPKASAIKEGADKMLVVTEDLKKAVEAQDDKKIKETGPKLEEAWKPFEDGVKDKYKDMYKKVEDSLSPTIAATEASPIDKAAVAKFNDQLAAALKELGDKEK
jgi:iron uptake system EfeUOB component EfeO/EfeM